MCVINGTPDSWKDSMGRTFEAWLIYGRHAALGRAMDNCLRRIDDHWVLDRHPNYRIPTSRDHWSYYIQYKRRVNDDEDFAKFIKDVPRMRGLTYWMKAATKSKLYQFLYYALYIPLELLGNWWNRFWRFVGHIKPERSHEEWEERGLEIQLGISKWTDWVRRNPLIPAYSMYNKVLQIYILPDCMAKKVLQRILRGRTGKYNYFIRVMLGDKKVTLKDVLTYQHRTGWRWGVNLDESCRRDVKIIRNPALIASNALETDILITMFYELRKIDLQLDELEIKINDLLT
jgi:hypothetical protein